jgi:hypothetical protein
VSKLKLNESLLKKVRFGPTIKEDVCVYHKAYLLGSFDGIPGFKELQQDLSLESFEQIFVDYVHANNLCSVTFYAFIDGFEIPIGIGMYWPRGRILQLADLIWFPWATKRSIYESSLGFFDNVRKTKFSEESQECYKILKFARIEDEKFFDRLVDLNVLVKVGKLDGIYETKAILYTTKED